MFERISIELTNQCSKGCSFCYNGSRPSGETLWTPSEVVSFVRDCAKNGVKAVSFGGGEPLEYDGLFDVLEQLDGIIFRSVTTNGLLLDTGAWEPLIAAKPDKVHVSLHFPQNEVELSRVVQQVLALEAVGITSGVNLLVARSQLDPARRAAEVIAAAGISPRQIVYLPMRGQDTPTPDELGSVAATVNFQSMSCLPKCGPSERFCSIRWDKTVAWCSYTESRRSLSELTFAGLCSAMHGIGLRCCDSSLVSLEITEVSSELHTNDVLLEPLAVASADYPAAHSMDTEWFATDKNGHVAVLETGEPGLMPKVFGETHGFEYFTMVDDILLSGANSSPYNLDDFFKLGEGIVVGPCDFPGPRDSNLSNRITTIAELTKISDTKQARRLLGSFRD